MKARWLTAAAAGVSAAACVSPVDYSSPTDGPPIDACDAYGHDEDGDCVNDKSDLCPMLPHAGPEDADGDGIGDACDPHPGHKDVRFLFTGFGPVDSPWTDEGDADWHIYADNLEVDLLPTPEIELPKGGTYYSTPLPTRVLIVAQVWIDHPGPKAEISLLAGYRPGPGAANECFVSRESGSLTWSWVDGGIRDAELNAAIAMEDPLFENGERFQLRIEHGYNRVDDAPAGTSCSYTTDAGSTATVSHETVRSAPGHLRIAARDVRMHVEWVAIYTDEATVPQLP